MVDNGAVMISHLLAQFVDKPKIEGLLRVLGRQLDLVEQAFIDLQEKRWVETAEGAQLDGCGVIVGQSRLVDKATYLPFFGFNEQPGGSGFEKAPFRKNMEVAVTTTKLDDEKYRMSINAKIGKNTARGTPEDVITGLRQVFSAKRVLIQEDNAKIYAAIGREVTGADLLFAQNSNLLVKPGGVKLLPTLQFDSEAVFGFRELECQGFGVGKFAKKIRQGGV